MHDPPLQILGHRALQPAAVVLHGFTGAPCSWQPVVTALTDKNHAALAALALPGHHPVVPVVPGWTGNIDGMAARLEEAAAAGVLALPVHVCGYSLGARVALGLAARHPGLVSRLTLIGVHPGLTSEDERTARRASDRAWITMLRERGLAAFVAAWQAQPIFSGQRAISGEARARQHAIRLGHDPLALAASLEHMGLAEMPDLGDCLTTLAVPVTVVTGQHDNKFSALAAGLVARRPEPTRSATLRHLVVPDAGHNVVLEQPDAIAGELLRADAADRAR